MLKLLAGNQEFIQGNKVTTLSLDELFEQAESLGKLETGSWSRHRAELKCNFTGSDYVNLQCDKYGSLKENIAEVVAKARRLKEFYQSEGL